MENYHILTVKYLGATNNRGSRIKITSDRFKESIVISYNYEYDTLEGAINHLNKIGFEITGKGEGKECYYLISKTFKNLK